jgi:hypothetical protein
MVDEYRRRRAYHEAGHVVAALRYGRRVLSVTVPPSAGGETKVDNSRLEALCKRGAPFSVEERVHLEQELEIRMSGRAAEMVILGDASEESLHDFAKMAEVAPLLGLNGLDTPMYELSALDAMEAPDQVEKLRVIGEALCARESLSEEETLDLLALSPGS